jgi:hypothetical protein
MYLQRALGDPSSPPKWGLMVNETELQIIFEAFKRGEPFNDMPELWSIAVVMFTQLDEVVKGLVHESRS